MGFHVLESASELRLWAVPTTATYNGNASFQRSSFEMRCTVPVPMASDLATFKIPTPFASCFRTFRSVAMSIFGRPSFTPWAMARLRKQQRCAPKNLKAQADRNGARFTIIRSTITGPL
jgi:hypothetical protein